MKIKEVLFALLVSVLAAAPAGAEKLSPDALIELDELPQGAPEGGNQ